MKTITIRILFLSAALFTLSACSSFLDKEPLDSGTEAIFFKNPDHFEQAANRLYSLPGWNNAYDRMDRGTDIAGFGSNGGGSAPESDGAWSYGGIRECNIVLQKAAEYAGDPNGIAQSVGTAYFFRAWHHFAMLQRFGGVPIADHVLDVDDPVLYGARNSRYEVANFIIADLDAAIAKLPIESEIGAADKGKISREAAKAFLSRVLLYEATWEKYAANVYDFDGDGVSVGAGTAKPDGYPSITDMLTRAKQLSGEVITEAEKGTYALWKECDSLSYYYLFNIDDGSGNIPNFKGAGKATNKEFIISSKYDYTLRRGGINLSHTVITWQASNISAQFGESFLCSNGLPIRISTTGSMGDAQNNPLFLGYGYDEDETATLEDFADEFRNRDYRFIGCAFLPDRLTWSSRTEDGRQLTELNKPYPTPIYPAPSDTYNAADPAYASKYAIFIPTIGINSTHNGYGNRKFLIEGEGRATQNTESADYPILRLAEVHLIYAEAACELGNGTISNADLDFSINKNRARAGVAPLTNELIANVWDAGWWDHAQNKTICKKMNMLDEIRRERACELFSEGFRMNDIKRWGVAHINLKGRKLGRKIYGTAYMTAKANDAVYFGETAYNPDTRPTDHGVYEPEDENDPDWGRAIATDPGNLLYSQRDYLAPLPLNQMRLNPQLKQNPEW